MLTATGGDGREVKPLAVIALGGNALCTSEDGSQEVDPAVLADTAGRLLKLFSFYESLVVTYGNGPQVGNDILRSEAAGSHVVPLAVHQCTANTQGRIGSALELAIRNAARGGGGVSVYGILSHVAVSDEPCTHFTKPIGPFYDKSTALKIDPGSEFTAEVAPGKFRRVVGSPRPIGVVEQEEIASLLRPRTIVLACGGGGVPVAYGSSGLVPVDAVVDKDLTSSLLAQKLNADLFMIVTKTDGVALGFNSAPRYVREMSTEAALYHLHNGEFPPGSMGPKVSACISYVWNTGREAVITSLDGMVDAVLGNAGTRFINSSRLAEKLVGCSNA